MPILHMNITNLRTWSIISLIFGHMQMQSDSLNFYFEITMYNKSHRNMLVYPPVLAWVSKIFTL